MMFYYIQRLHFHIAPDYPARPDKKKENKLLIFAACKTLRSIERELIFEKLDHFDRYFLWVFSLL